VSRLEFLLDRGLGRGVADGLRAHGWFVHRIADHVPDDAQHVADEDWLSHGLERGWVPLCKDGRIKGRHHEREPLVVHSAVLFYLDNQQLRRATRWLPASNG
jgi:NAD(P)-dependent dehydrogenase (short-subunit alcohol dehydrogenase family)